MPNTSRKLERLFAAPVKAPRRARLKPCPFDGGAARLLDRKAGTLPHQVECVKCHACGPRCRKQAFAVRLWNNRQGE